MTVINIGETGLTVLPERGTGISQYIDSSIASGFPVVACLIGAGTGFLVKRELIWAAVGAILAYLIAMQARKVV